jgi:hypothetical protein
MPEPEQTNPFRADRYRDAEAQLGGADDVQKTTYVVGEGTEPGTRKGEGPTAQISGGISRGLVWIVGALVALVLVGYLLGIGR